MGSRFWYLVDSHPEPRASWNNDQMRHEIVRCPADPGIVRGGKRYHAHQRSGKRLSILSVLLGDGPVDDFTQTWQSDWLVTVGAVHRLATSSLTGFETRTVQSRFAESSEETPELEELVITGWAGMASPESGIRLNESRSCQACGRLEYTCMTNPSQLIDVARWDGSDFFMVWPLPKYVFVSERVASFIQQQRIQGVQAKPLAEMGVSSPHVTPGYVPGRLSYYMPDPRARCLGEPLGIY
jgi:hypothetical protein